MDKEDLLQRIKVLEGTLRERDANRWKLAGVMQKLRSDVNTLAWLLAELKEAQQKDHDTRG